MKNAASPDRAPAGYWEEVIKARRQAAQSLSAALGPTSPDALEAHVDGLTAESSGLGRRRPQLGVRRSGPGLLGGGDPDASR